jgi:hypothetical protein
LPVLIIHYNKFQPTWQSSGTTTKCEVLGSSTAAFSFIKRNETSFLLKGWKFIKIYVIYVIWKFYMFYYRRILPSKFLAFS